MGVALMIVGIIGLFCIDGVIELIAELVAITISILIASLPFLVIVALLKMVF